MNVRQINQVFALILSMLMIAGASNGRATTGETKALEGPWVTEGYGSVVNLAPCRQNTTKLCGEIVWLWEATDQNGDAVLDAENSDPDLRTQPLMGRIIVIDMERRAADPLAADGKIYNPDDGRTYRASIALTSEDTLHVEGCVMFICRTQVWRRPGSLPRFDKTAV